MREVYVIGIFAQPEVREASMAAMKNNRMHVSQLIIKTSLLNEEKEEAGVLVQGVVVTSRIGDFHRSLITDLRVELDKRNIPLTQDVTVFTRSSDTLEEHQVYDVPIGKGLLSMPYSEN